MSFIDLLNTMEAVILDGASLEETLLDLELDQSLDLEDPEILEIALGEVDDPESSP